MKEPAFVYHHVPKCGGTSFLASLYRWFAVVPDYEDGYPSRAVFEKAVVSSEDLCASTLLTGHWNVPGSLLSERYPEVMRDDRFQRFTMLREPFELAKSLFYYIRKRSPEVARAEVRMRSLRDFVMTQENFLAAQLAVGGQFESLSEVFSRYYFVGITEKFGSSVDLFRRLTVRRLEAFPASRMAQRMRHRIRAIDPVVEYLNRAERDDEERVFGANDRAAFRRRNALDEEIYRTALECLGRMG